jgi:acetyltransferase-like isoleucine patch superfamily enzyme
VSGIAFDLAPEQRQWHLSGWVRDGAGNPVGGGVRLYNPLGWHLDVLWTDHLGNFESGPLADGTYYASTIHTHEVLDEAWANAPCVNQLCDVVAVGTPIVIDGGDVSGLNFVLDPITSGGHIGGEIRGPDGPLAYAGLEVLNANGHHLFGLNTDADGFYWTPLLASGSYFVVTQNEPMGLGRELWDDVACIPFWICWDSWFVMDNGTPIEISGGNRTGIDFDLVIPPGGRISGQLIDSGTGLPVMGSWMTLVNADTGEFLAGTGANANGEYFFTGLEAGDYKILAEWPPEGYTPELYGGDHWPCDLQFCGGSVHIAGATSEVSGANIYLDYSGTRIVGRITRSDTGEPVNSMAGHVGVDLFSADGHPMGGTGANEAGLYEIRLDGGGEFYLLAVNEVDRHHLLNEVWNDIPCIDHCYPPDVAGADLVNVHPGQTFVANFALDPRTPPEIERRAEVHSSVVIGDFSVNEEHVVIDKYAHLGIFVEVVKNAEIGAHCLIGNYVHIGHNSVLGPECSVGDFTFVDMNVRIGARVYIGHETKIGKNVRIGNDAAIGANVTLGKGVVVWPGVCIPDHITLPKDTVIDTSLCH